MIRIIHSIQNGNFADLAIHCEWANGAKWLKQIGIKHLNEGDSYPEQSMSTKETELNVYLLNEYVEKINFARRERLTSIIGEET